MVNEYDCLSLSGTFKDSTLSFTIASTYIQSHTPITWVTSGPIECSKINCELQCYLNDQTYLLRSKLIFCNLNDDNEVSTKSALILMDYKLERDNYTFGVRENAMFKIFPTKSVFELDPFYIGSCYNMPTTYLEIYLKFVQIFDYSSTLYYSLGPPSKAPFFQLLNSKDISNASFKLQSQGKIIWVVKQIICNECPFFEKMLQKKWMKKTKNDDKIPPVEIANWSDQVLIAIILYLYTGWLPGTQICEEVYDKLNIDESEFNFDSNSWLELSETAKMLELSALAVYAALEAKKYLSTKIDNFIQTFSIQEST